MPCVGGTFQQEISGTDYPGCPATPVYQDQHGKQLVSMGSEEYCSFITAAMSYFSQNRNFRRRRAGAMLMHDRSQVHQSAFVRQQLLSMGLEVELLPPRSPDLMPLDYGIFGTSKLQLERHGGRAAPWGERVSMFKHVLQSASILPSIDQFQQRLQAVIVAGGKHIDRALREIKNGVS